MEIDNSFITKWEQKYDCTENDEAEYQDLVKILHNKPKLTKELLIRVINWKSKRTKGYIKWSEIDDYIKEFYFCYNNPNEYAENMKKLDDLPGIGVPIASTILHLIFPDIYPIIDIRTVTTLHKAGELSLYSENEIECIQKYVDNFRPVVMAIQKKLNRTLRQIDRALFAYDKNCNKSKGCS